MNNDIIRKKGNIIHSLVLERHISKIHFAIEGSRTGGKSTAVIIVCQVNSVGYLSSQTWMTSASLSALRFLWSSIFSRSPWLILKACPICFHLYSMGDNKRIRSSLSSIIIMTHHQYILLKYIS